ncbi:uncharacterized protein LOC116653011 [Coturnix japonica]|uniref:uncharacterized protein LOC116653011 n=1 Tax=Coturnix japonica TaxID=93934 RepID=UPI0013A5C130|nr:uncharacterized protein LOC116653011 [Coturnix japonica]
MDLLIGRPRNPESTERKRRAFFWIPKKPKNPENPEKQHLLPTRTTMLMLLCLLCLCWSPVGGIHLIQQPGNLWVTWANQTGRTDFCLSLQSATSPFQTCLIGIPVWEDSGFQGYLRSFNFSAVPQDSCSWFCNPGRIKITDRGLGNDTVILAGRKMACVICRLNVTLPWEPQELQILGSQMVPNDSWDTIENHWWSPECLTFACTPIHRLTLWVSLLALGPYWNAKESRSDPFTLVYPRNTEQFAWDGPYCGFYPNRSIPMTDNTYCSGFWINKSQIIDVTRSDGSRRKVDCEPDYYTKGCCVSPWEKGSGPKC